MEQKLLLEKKLTVARGLLATCQLDLTSCRGQAVGEKEWLAAAGPRRSSAAGPLRCAARYLYGWSAPPPVPDFDFFDADALAVAKDMFKIWSVSLGTKKNLARA